MFEKMKKKGTIPPLVMGIIWIAVGLAVVFLLAAALVPIINTSGNSLANAKVYDANGSEITTGGAKTIFGLFGGSGIILVLVGIAILIGAIVLILKHVAGGK